MDQENHEIRVSYLDLVRKHLTEPNASDLKKAYELGQRTVASGLSLLDLAALHREAVHKHLSHIRSDSSNGVNDAAIAVLREAVTAFAVTLIHDFNTDEKRSDSKQSSPAITPEAVLRACEAERKRISRELHDELGQILLAVHVNLAVAQKLHGTNVGESSDRIQNAMQLLEECMKTVRQVARELRPPMIDELGFVPALHAYADAYSRRTGIRVRIRLDPSASRLDELKQTVLYRVTQESLTNVQKHANATEVQVKLVQHHGKLEFEIRDNGKASTLKPKRQSNDGLGVRGMRERVQQVGGRFSFDQASGKGTTIRVALPL